MTSAQCNGITIEYESYGEGEALLLVMGLGGQLVAWPTEWVERLVDRGFQAIRFDNRDIGLSSKMPAKPPSFLRIVASSLSRRLAKSSYLLSDMADDAVALLDHLGIDLAHIVGVSMGGMISQSIAIGHPDRVLSLTSIMSNTGDRKHGRVHRSLYLKAPKSVARTREEAVDKGVELFRWISGPRFEDDSAELRELLAAALERSWDVQGTARQTMAISASPDRTKDLGRLKVSTLVVHGLVDPLVMPDGGVATAKAIPGSRLLMFPDMGHDLPKVRWNEIIDAIVTNAERAGFQPKGVEAATAGANA